MIKRTQCRTAAHLQSIQWGPWFSEHFGLHATSDVYQTGDTHSFAQSLRSLSIAASHSSATFNRSASDNNIEHWDDSAIDSDTMNQFQFSGSSPSIDHMSNSVGLSSLPTTAASPPPNVTLQRVAKCTEDSLRAASRHGIDAAQSIPKVLRALTCGGGGGDEARLMTVLKDTAVSEIAWDNILVSLTRHIAVASNEPEETRQKVILRQRNQPVLKPDSLLTSRRKRVSRTLAAGYGLLNAVGGVDGMCSNAEIVRRVLKFAVLANDAGLTRNIVKHLAHRGLLNDGDVCVAGVAFSRHRRGDWITEAFDQAAPSHVAVSNTQQQRAVDKGRMGLRRISLLAHSIGQNAIQAQDVIVTLQRSIEQSDVGAHHSNADVTIEAVVAVLQASLRAAAASAASRVAGIEGSEQQRTSLSDHAAGLLHSVMLHCDPSVSNHPRVLEAMFQLVSVDGQLERASILAPTVLGRRRREAHLSSVPVDSRTWLEYFVAGGVSDGIAKVEGSIRMGLTPRGTALEGLCALPLATRRVTPQTLKDMYSLFQTIEHHDLYAERSASLFVANTVAALEGWSTVPKWSQVYDAVAEAVGYVERHVQSYQTEACCGVTVSGLQRLRQMAVAAVKGGAPDDIIRRIDALLSNATTVVMRQWPVHPMVQVVSADRFEATSLDRGVRWAAPSDDFIAKLASYTLSSTFNPVVALGVVKGIIQSLTSSNATGTAGVLLLDHVLVLNFVFDSIRARGVQIQSAADQDLVVLDASASSVFRFVEAQAQAGQETSMCVERRDMVSPVEMNPIEMESLPELSALRHPAIFPDAFESAISSILARGLRTEA